MSGKVQQIVVRTSSADLHATYPPYGYYHILKCYDYERGDYWAVAFLSIDDYTLEQVRQFAQQLADQHGCKLYIEEYDREEG